MNILITGSAGLVGSACMELFVEKGWQVTGIDNNGRSEFFGTEKRPVFNEVDIRDEAAINKLFSEIKFDAIIHAAGQPSHDYATDHVLEDFDVNARGTVILLEATRKYCPEAVFVHVSTDKVYGENMRLKFLDESATRFVPSKKVARVQYERGFTEELGLDFAGDRSFFGCSKAAADMYAQQYAVRFGMKLGIFRPGCITGKNHAGAEQHGFLAYLARCIREGETYHIFGNGKAVRDQIHSSDIALAFREFIENPTKDAVFNIGGGPKRSISVLEAGEALSKKIGKPFIHDFAEARRGDRLYDVHDCSKFRKAYPNWEYNYSLDNILDELAQI